MTRLMALLLTCIVLFACGFSVAEGIWETQGKLIRQYDGETLKYTIEQLNLNGSRGYLTRIWMLSPGEQIVKATANWEKDIRYPSDIAKRLEQKALLVINGSGYVSPVYPEIPDNYPGTSKDYHYTPLGSLTVTNGEVYRLLDGVPYYGLTLQSDGLHLHRGEAPNEVLKQNPTQTWSFYENCPLIDQGEIVLPDDWAWADRKAIRNIICKMDDHNYMVLIVSDKSRITVTLRECVDYLYREFHPEMAYNLDGGPSAALLARKNEASKLVTIYGNSSKDADIMGFVELKH